MYLQFETNTDCNAHCSFCPHDTMTKRPEMPMDMIEKILSETKEYVVSILPFLYQEPLIEHRLFDILAACKRINPNAKTALYSNMAAMTEPLALDLIDTGVLDEIYISFYGPTEELYHKYQPPLPWEQTKENIKRFCTLAKRRIRTTMWYLDIPDLVDRYPGYLSEWSRYADRIDIVGFESYNGLFPGIREYHQNERKPCLRPWQKLNIVSDGTVIPCCLDYNATVPLGNAFEENCMDIWTGPVFEEFRRVHAEGIVSEMPELCQTCDVWKRT